MNTRHPRESFYVRENDPNNSKKPEGSLVLTPLWLLAFITVLVALGCFLLVEILLHSGSMPIAVPIISFVAPLVCAVAELWAGLRVRAYQRGKVHMNSLRAGQIFIFAQAGSRAGSIFLGSALGVIAAYAHIGPTDYFAEQMFHLALAALASFALIVASYAAERWCRIDDSEGSSASCGGVASA